MRCRYESGRGEEMREILYRGKRVDTGEWIYGYYVKQSKHACFASGLKCQHFIYKDVFLDFNLGGIQEFGVIPETVGQYTGLTDKNGKKVFEGDIVKWDYPCNSEHFYQVKYDAGCACFTTSRIHNSDVIDCIFDNDGNHCEVIGNIHDNPDLLKGGEVR